MISSKIQKKIVSRLLALRPKLLKEWGFKNIPSDRFLVKNPNAFLFAVIMDYGVKAERAWAAPYELKRRLGHFNIRKISKMSAYKLGEIMKQKPALHRFCNNVAKYIIAASKKLLLEYSGNAKNIWKGTKNSAEILVRLLAFPGMGPKKAHMMAKILVNELGVKMNTQFIDVQYDTHVKRVFKRAGLSYSDNYESVILAGRMLNPNFPGALDTPAWYIGRTWCRPRNPNCKECYIKDLCPKLI